MTAHAPAPTQVPDWLVGEMPPGYETRLGEIRRLASELREMVSIGRVLWETGKPLEDAVVAVFAALKHEVGAAPGVPGALGVKLDGQKRLLVHVARAAGAIQKTSEELAQVFQLVQFAGPNDRVVLVANNDVALRPADRPDPVAQDALAVLQRIGVNVATTGTLFGLWRLSFEDPRRVATLLDRLHAQDGGALVSAAR